MSSTSFHTEASLVPFERHQTDSSARTFGGWLVSRTYSYRRIFLSGDFYYLDDEGNDIGEPFAHVNVLLRFCTRAFEMTFLPNSAALSESTDHVVAYQPAGYEILLRGWLNMDSEVRILHHRDEERIVSRTLFSCPLFARTHHVISNGHDVQLVAFKSAAIFSLSFVVYRGTNTHLSTYSANLPLAVIRQSWPARHHLDIIDQMEPTQNELNALFWLMIVINDIQFHRK